jgi:hypothetical protein
VAAAFYARTMGVLSSPQRKSRAIVPAFLYANSLRDPGAATVNLAGAVSNPPTQAQAQGSRDKVAAGIINT